MFESLSSRLEGIWKRLRGKGKLSESDVNESLKEVRMALLEADVNFKVAKDFVEKVRAKAVGQEVLRSLSPAQQVIKTVHEELTALLGSEHKKLNLSPRPPSVFMLVGLQGSGKTTTAAKLANHLRRDGKRPLLVAADVRRPAAVDQIRKLGEALDIPVFTVDDLEPLRIATEAVAHAGRTNRDVVLIDTAGRLHIDEELMRELELMKGALDPAEILLVVDSMTGQDAVSVAETFNRQLGLTGVILTKLDGDARGGAALSVKAVTGCPVKFVGVGEKLDALEPFYPDRMASRILGMGDVMTLIEKAERVVDAEKAAEFRRKIKNADFTIEDFVDQLRSVRQMGPLDQILGMMPGFGQLKKLKGLQVDEKQLVYAEAIVNSMTREERQNPHIIDGSRRRRIALGSGTSVQEVNRLLKQFEETRKLLKKFGDLEKKQKKIGPRFPFM